MLSSELFVVLLHIFKLEIADEIKLFENDEIRIDTKLNFKSFFIHRNMQRTSLNRKLWLCQ